MIMKLRYVFLALLTLTTAATLSAQTMTTAAWASKAKSARSVANDLRHKKVQKAAATVLKDKDVQSRTHIDKALQDKITETKLKSAMSQTKADVRRDPVAFGTKSAKEIRKYKKHTPKWLRHKSKKRAPNKK
jgi:hypothetical protein